MTRLNRYLSSCGLGSRRGSEELILSGKVRVNGQLVTSLATKVNPGDEVSVRGQRLAPQKTLIVALHKPKGYVCTRSDERDRQTIYDLLPREYQTLHHIGRLDMDSSGLILLTNDGALSHRLTHPSKGIEKEYEVTVEALMDEYVAPKLVKGMMTPEGFAKAERAWLYGGYKVGIVLKQGLKRQIRHMLYNLGHEVRHLVRVRIGGYHLKGMALGSWRELPEKEAAKLLQDAEKEVDASTKKAHPKKNSAAGSKPEGISRWDIEDESEKQRRGARVRRNEERAAPAEAKYETKSRKTRGTKVERPRAEAAPEKTRRGFRARRTEESAAPAEAKYEAKPWKSRGKRAARPRIEEAQVKPRHGFKPRRGEENAAPAEPEYEGTSQNSPSKKAVRPRRSFKSRDESPKRFDTSERSSRLDSKPRVKPKGTRHGGQRTPLSRSKRGPKNKK